jgi:hypothetical protein
MPTRVLLAYLLIALMLAGGAYVAWRMIYNSEHNVRRRARRERRARYKAAMASRDESAELGHTGGET